MQTEQRERHPFHMYDAIYAQPEAFVRALEKNGAAVDEFAAGAASCERLLLVGHRQPSPARYHVVDFVLGVRLLIVHRPRRPARNGQAQGGRAKELGEIVPVGVEPGDQLLRDESVHRLRTPCFRRTRGVNHAGSSLHLHDPREDQTTQGMVHVQGPLLVNMVVPFRTSGREGWWRDAPR